MFANQVSLLELGRMSGQCTPSPAANMCPQGTFLGAPPARPRKSRTTYIAFNDVNDLLGFELPPYLETLGMFGRLVNITVDNPGKFLPWLFKWPPDAHSNQSKDRAVIRAIAHGFCLPTGGAKPPVHC
jgi:hypothetical protein